MSISPAKRWQVFFIGFLVCAILAFSYGANATENLVTGKYASSSGSEIILNLDIQNPAPRNLIVEQDLSSENKIIATSPQANKIDNTQGNVKWFFKNTKSGLLTLLIKLSDPLVGDISATVRYRSPQGGTLTELRITP